MRQNKYKIQVGDVLYEASFTYRKVIEWKITDIYLEDYLDDVKTVFTVVEVGKGFHGRGTKLISDIRHWHNTKEEAEEELQRKLDTCPWWRDKQND